jgi:hypothetical protein
MASQRLSDPGDALEAGRAHARCLLRRPPFAVPHHHGVLTDPVRLKISAVATALKFIGLGVYCTDQHGRYLQPEDTP